MKRWLGGRGGCGGVGGGAGVAIPNWRSRKKKYQGGGGEEGAEREGDRVGLGDRGVGERDKVVRWRQTE